MKISIFSGMFKNQALTTAIMDAAKIGYDGVEIMIGFGGNHLASDSSPDYIAGIDRCARDNGIDLCLIYTTLGSGILTNKNAAPSDLAELDRFLAIGDKLSCKTIKVTAGRLRDSDYRDDEARIVADWLAEACDRAAKHGSRVVAEIHFGQYCETVQMARKIIDLVDRPNFGVIHDAGNLHITGIDYGQNSIDILGDRIFHVHIKDMVRASTDDPTAHDYLAGRFKRALLGKGDVDHLPLFRALKKIGYEGYLSCEASGEHLGPVETARHEYRAVTELLKRA